MNYRQKMVQQQFLNNEEAVIKRLTQVYTQSLKDCTAKAAQFQAQIDELTAVYDTLEDEAEKEVMKSRIRSKIYQKQYQDAMQKQFGDILDDMHKKNYETVAEYLEGCYDEGFMGALYDLQGQGIPLSFPIDQEAVTRAVQLDSKISEGMYRHLGEDVSQLKKHITAQVSRGISTGMTFEAMAQQLRFKMIGTYNNPGGSLAYALRIARTEGHRIQVQSTMDACHKAKEKGADVVKQWDSTLDAKTRTSHQKVDGEVRELDKPFSNGLMFPGDPDGGAAEVINCRCALLQRGKWELDGGFTKMNNFTKQLESFESPEDYAEFKKSFFSKENRQYMNYVSKMEEKYGTKNFAKILDAMDTREYNHYSKLLEGNPVFNKKATTEKITFVPAKTIEEAEATIKAFVDDTQWGAMGISYSGISVKSANAVNEALVKLYDTFNLDKLGGVYVAKGNTKLGKQISNATAAYSPVRKTLLLNNNAMKNLDDVVKSKAEELRLIALYKENPSNLVFKTDRARKTVEASLISGRATVADDIADAINHEMGHSIERAVAKSSKFDSIKNNMSKYAPNVSGYATIDTSEYIAESFTSYLKGEKVIDPDLREVFESFKKGKTGAKALLSADELKNLDKIGNSSIILSDRQFGHKIGKHTKEYGLDPSKPEDRDKMLSIITDIVENNDEVVKGNWRDQAGVSSFYIKGEDVVVVNAANEFVTILKEGVNNNARVKEARKRKVY